MSGVIHPVGPEPARTYWVRRGVLIVIVLLLAVFVAVAVANLTKAAVVTAPSPAAPVPPATSPTPTSTRAAAPDASAPPIPSTPPTPSALASAPSRATASGSPASPSASTATSGTTPSASSTATPAAQPRPTTTIIGTPDCRPADLRVSLTGDTTLPAGQKTRFTASLVNEGKRTCLISVTAKNFQLTIHSGKDRIWSTTDCAATVRAFDKKLAVEGDVAWTVTWDGQRSVRGATCKRAPETPGPGTYRATAELDGADPVRLRLVIR